MKKYTILILIAVFFLSYGCDRDDIEISEMGIHDVQIHVSDINKELTEIRMLGEERDKYFAVTALVRSDLGGCRSYHDTQLFKNGNKIDYSTDFIFWNPGETIRIDIYESEPTGYDFDCTDDFYYFYQAIFVGFCVHGEYTIVVNNYQKKFTITETGTIS